MEVDTYNLIGLVAAGFLGSVALTKFLTWLIRKAVPNRPFLCFAIVSVLCIVIAYGSWLSRFQYVICAFLWYLRDRHRAANPELIGSKPLLPNESLYRQPKVDSRL